MSTDQQHHSHMGGEDSWVHWTGMSTHGLKLHLLGSGQSTAPLRVVFNGKRLKRVYVLCRRQSDRAHHGV